MNILLDTCSFLWLTVDSPELSVAAKDLFRDPSNEVYLSAASNWEIAVKYRLGRLPLPSSPSQFVPGQRERHGIETLPLEEAAINHLEKLPDHHRDPFDRILVCQAIEHGLVILTPDKLIRPYPVKVVW
jgi:PIN domain nuclease of toxin-antitoxin system